MRFVEYFIKLKFSVQEVFEIIKISDEILFCEYFGPKIYLQDTWINDKYTVYLSYIQVQKFHPKLKLLMTVKTTETPKQNSKFYNLRKCKSQILLFSNRAQERS